MIRLIDGRIARKLSSIRQAFRAGITRVNSGPNISLIQLGGVAGEMLQDNELMQQYGFTSHPPVGSVGIVLPLGGKTSQAVIIATEHTAYRLKYLQEGEVAVYNTFGASVILHADGSVSVNSAASVSITATDTVTVNAPLVNVPNGDVTASGISLINHKHTGVQAGSSQTGIAI